MADAYGKRGLVPPLARPMRHEFYHKGREIYRFSYRWGDEADFLEALLDLARTQKTEFDLIDAAIITQRLVESLICEAKQLLAERGKP